MAALKSLEANVTRYNQLAHRLKLVPASAKRADGVTYELRLNREASSQAEFANVDLKVTIASDYQVPKVMRSMGILEYSDALAAIVNGEQLIASGSKEELAIRAAAILAGEEISKKFSVAVAQLDWWIWSQRNNDPSAKFHLTVTTDY